MGQFAVILPAAGRSTRFGDPKQKKIFAELDGRAVWLRAIEPFVNRDDVGQMIVVIAPEDRELFERRYEASVAFLNITVIDGGAERSDSVARALEVVDPSCEFVAVHDAARPCLTTELVDARLRRGPAPRGGAAGRAGRRHDQAGRRRPIHGRDDPRGGLFLAQTPQAFRRDLLVRAYANRARIGAGVTDDTQLVEASGHPCAVVEGSPLNLKITTAADLRLASAILQSLPKPKGEGPVHPFADERAMWGDVGPRTSRARPAGSLRALWSQRGLCSSLLPSIALARGRLHGVGPDAVALGAEVQEVGHDVAGDRAVVLEEALADVEILDRLAVVELGDLRVDRRQLVADRARLLAAGEDAQEEDLGLGELLAERLDDGGHAVGDRLGGVRAGVVGADHQDDDLGVDPLDLAVLEPPEDVLGPVAADPEVGRLARGVEALPDLVVRPSPG